jgi:hypothetical protein
LHADSHPVQYQPRAPAARQPGTQPYRERLAVHIMRQTYLSNRVFLDYDDVVEISSSAWNKLIAEQRIASIGTRSWTAISQGP